MATRISDEDWHAICATAKRVKLTPDADARPAIEACLAEYPAFAYDAEHVEALWKNGRRMVEHCDALADLFAQGPVPADAIGQECNFWCIERLRRSALMMVLACQANRRANKGHHDVQQEMLVSRLCGIWLNNFNAGRLGTTRGGPLSRFLLAVMRLVVPEQRLPGPEALRGAIMRERDEREAELQWKLNLRRRAQGGSSTCQRKF
jgi:hypothetical protein